MSLSDALIKYKEFIENYLLHTKCTLTKMYVVFFSDSAIGIPILDHKELLPFFIRDTYFITEYIKKTYILDLKKGLNSPSAGAIEVNYNFHNFLSLNIVKGIKKPNGQTFETINVCIYENLIYKVIYLQSQKYSTSLIGFLFYTYNDNKFSENSLNFSIEPPIFITYD